MQVCNILHMSIFLNLEEYQKFEKNNSIFFTNNMKSVKTEESAEHHFMDFDI